MTIPSLLTRARNREFGSCVELGTLARLMTSNGISSYPHSKFAEALVFLGSLVRDGVLKSHCPTEDRVVTDSYELFVPYSDDPYSRYYRAGNFDRQGRTGEMKPFTGVAKRNWPAGAVPLMKTETLPAQVSVQDFAACLAEYKSDFEEAGFYSRALQAWLDSHKELARIAQMKAAAAAVADKVLILPRATLKRDWCFCNPVGDLGAGVIASFENRLTAVRALAVSMGRQVQAPDGGYFVATVTELALLLDKRMIFREKTPEEKGEERRLRDAKKKKVDPMKQA